MCETGVWQGAQCQEPFDPCSGRCNLEHGRCVDYGNLTAECVCDPDYTGEP